MSFMNRKAIPFLAPLLSALFILLAFCAKAQLPTCNIIYSIKSSSASVYNFDPSLPPSVTNPVQNTIPLPSTNSTGLTVCPVLRSGNSTLTFYTLLEVASSGLYYAYYNPTTNSWVNTGHVSHTVNIAAGGGYIFGLNGSTGDVYRYDGGGNDVLITNVAGFRGAGPYDLVADCDGNWYVLNQTSTPYFLRKYSPAGALLQSWTISNPNNLTVSPSGGFAIIGSTLYTDNALNGGIASYTLTPTTLTLNSTVAFSPPLNSYDLGSCAGSVPTIPLISITASANNVCAGTPVTFTANPISGGSAPIYQWLVNGVPAGTSSVTFTYIPADNDVVTCVLTSNSVCATSTTANSNAITMAVTSTNTIAAVTVSPSSNNVCPGTQVTFTALPVNGGTSPVYQWKVNGIIAGTNSATYRYIPVNNDVVTCAITSNVSCIATPTVTSPPVTMSVTTTSAPGITVVPSANNICSGTSVTFNATPLNGGPGPVYTWKVNGVNAGTNSAAFTYIPANNDIVTCMLTSNSPCATIPTANSNSVTMVVNSIPSTPVTISGTAMVCTGNSYVYITNPVSGATSYQWTFPASWSGAGTATSINLTAGSAGGAITVAASNVCGTSATQNFAVTTIPTGTPAVTLTSSPYRDTVCSNVPVTFTATGTNIVGTPVYTFRKNGTIVNGAGNTYTDAGLATGDVISVAMNLAHPCLGNVSATAQVGPMTLVPSVYPGININTIPPTSLCAGNPVTFISNITGGGGNPRYQWYKNGQLLTGVTTPNYNTADFANGDTLQVSLTSSASCPLPPVILSNKMGVQVSNTVNPSVVISANPSGSVPQGTTVIFTATPSNGGAAPVYEWKRNGITIPFATGPVYTTSALRNGDVITASLNSSEPCKQEAQVGSNWITMRIGTTSITGIAGGSGGWSLYPNPNNGYFTVSISGNPALMGKRFSFDVINTLGQTVYHAEATPDHNDQWNQEIQLGGEVANGCYLMRVSSEGKLNALPFVLKR